VDSNYGISTFISVSCPPNPQNGRFEYLGSEKELRHYRLRCRDGYTVSPSRGDTLLTCSGFLAVKTPTAVCSQQGIPSLFLIISTSISSKIKVFQSKVDRYWKNFKLDWAFRRQLLPGRGKRGRKQYPGVAGSLARNEAPREIGPLKCTRSAVYVYNLIIFQMHLYWFQFDQTILSEVWAKIESKVLPWTKLPRVPRTQEKGEIKLNTHFPISALTCLPSEFKCRQKPECVPKRVVCDGRPNCQDRTDESPATCGGGCKCKRQND
jgi:hypothetical protein